MANDSKISVCKRHKIRKVLKFTIATASTPTTGEDGMTVPVSYMYRDCMLDDTMGCMRTYDGYFHELLAPVIAAATEVSLKPRSHRPLRRHTTTYDG